MNKYVVFLLSFSFILLFNVNAQEQLEHKARTYIAPDGKLYIQRYLPIYLRLATSADENAETILLKSKISEKYTNPMYLDNEGVHYIRHDWAVDQSSKKMVYPQREVKFEIYGDGLAPITRSVFSPAPKHVKGGIIYYGKGLTVNLPSRDAVSGVEKTYFSIDAASYSEYSSTLAMDKEKEYILKYYAADNVGNAEKPSTRKYTVDLTSPTSKHSVSQPKLDDIISPKAKITLSFSDALSGVRKTNYYFDNRSHLNYYRPISLYSLSDGNHTLTYFSTDNVKNVENKIVYKFYLDKIPPVVSYKIVGDQFFGNCKYISSRTTLDLSATDNKAGVDKVFYSIDGTGKNTYSSPFKVPTRDGKHVIAYWGVDKVTNLANKKYVTVCMDNTKPSTSIRYGNPQFFTRDTLFINKLTPITLTPRDYGAGIAKTEYSVNDGGNKTYSAAFKIPEEGDKTIKFFSTDKVNNVEDAKTSKCFVDNTPPVIYVHFSIEPIDKKDGLNVYPNYTRLFVGATDVHVGTEKIQHSINGGSWKLYSSPRTLDMSEVKHFLKTKKKYVVKIKAKDKLGNESEKTIEFYVSTK
ncbi:MAG: hypothetical protein U9R42_07935 [Bacteroidota bacterium]|nr:hypothetical protein [Bacteroidota bacterium]